ncbi:porin family protein [Chitinophaga niabensis]|nr:porin family protein [Chitinophaga niabensis]
MNKNILIALCMLIAFKANAQKNIHQYVHAGFNIGALAPVSLPNTIRKVESYSPLFSPAIGYEIVYVIKGKWGIGAGLKVEYKGMRVKDSVQYFHTIITQQSSSGKSEFEGDFTGTNQTKAHNLYLTLPINAVFQPSEKWRFKLGFYAAYLLAASFDGTVSNGYIRNGNSFGEKVIIDQANFDFAKEERKFDWGLQGGAERKVGKRLAVAANLQWGLQPVFPSTFKGVGFNMYNIFLGLGVSYKL